MAAARTQRQGHSHGAATANGKTGTVLRKIAYLVALFGAVGVTLLPLSLMMVGGEDCAADAAAGLAHDPPNWFQQANPFSHSNLCRIKRNIASMHKTSASSSAPISHVGWNGDSPGSQAGAHPADASAGGPPPSSSNDGATSGAAQDSASSPPPAADGDKGPAERPVWSAAEQEAAWARQRAANKQRQRRISGDQYDEIELPENDADVERILRYPHYDECNLCKVCVPLDVVKGHPKAQAHPAVRKVVHTQTLDEDVTVEVESPDDAASFATSGGKARRRQLRLSHGRPQRGGGDALREQGGSSSSNMTVARRHRRRLLGGGDKDDKDETESDSVYYIKGKRIDIFDIAPGDTKAGPRKALPNCTVCWGCTHTLEMMASGSVVAGSYFSHEPGGSPSWLFRVRSNRTRSGWAVVKSWCVPVRKVKQRGLAMCSPPKVYAQVKLLLAQNKVIRQCGLNSIIPALWVEPVRGVIPGHGFRIDWLGLWADVADGASVQNIHEFGKPRTNPQLLLDLLVNKINHTEMQMVAVFDVLTSQCDRHQQNLFLTETGKVWAIDNDQVFSVAWRKCGFDSMLLPTTQKFAINHMGFFYVLKYPQKDPPKQPAPFLNPLMLLDYRCHVPGGVLGQRFPGTQLAKCLERISGLSPPRIMVEYGYPSMRMAHALYNRSRDLHTKGFEWALLYSQPTNQPMHRYKVPPACCNMTHDPKTNKYTCTTPWKQQADLPFGNPWHGGKWHGTPGKDTGTFTGGTVF